MAKISDERTLLLAQIGSCLGQNDHQQMYERIISKVNLYYTKKNVNPKGAEELFPQKIVLQKYDIIKCKFRCCDVHHYGVIINLDKELNTAWLLVITSDPNLPNIIPTRSRMFPSSFFVAEFVGFYLLQDFKFCGTFEDKKTVDNAVRIVKNYYKTNFREQRKTQKKD